MKRGRMIDDLKIWLFLMGMAVISAFIRFKNVFQFFLDAALGFAMGWSFYLLLGYWIEDGATRSGFVGLVILCSRPLYDWADRFIRNKLTKTIERKFK